MTWLSGPTRSPHAVIHEIDVIDVPDATAGGNRQRVLVFAAQAWGYPRIRFFIDADADRILGLDVGSQVWLTDGRDLEGYLLRPDCLEKVWSLAAGSDIEARALLRRVLEIARRMAAIRLVSDEHGLDLPFQSARLSRCVEGEGPEIAFDSHRWVTSLFQSADVSLARLDWFENAVEAMLGRLANVTDYHLVHGHDCVGLIAASLGSRVGRTPFFGPSAVRADG